MTCISNSFREWKLVVLQYNFQKLKMVTCPSSITKHTITISYDSESQIRGSNIYHEEPLLDKFVLLRGYGVCID